MSIRSQHEQELSSPADGRETLSENVAWHTLAVTAAAVRLGSDPARGLSEAEASGRLAQSGPNRLAELRGRSALNLKQA